MRNSVRPRTAARATAHAVRLAVAAAWTASACSSSSSGAREAGPPAETPAGRAAGTPAGSSAAAGPGTRRSAPPSSAFMLTEDQRARIRTEPVTEAEFRPTIATTGTVAFNGDRSTPVLSQISGPVVRILANVGTRVLPGAPLAMVTSPDFAQAVASYQKAQTALHNAARIATLDEQLFQNDAIARSELDQARADSATAAADREAAIQQMVALGVDSTIIDAVQQGRPVPPVSGVIRAPIGGEVVERLINPGQVLEANQTQCFTIADLATVWVMANVFESDLSGVSKGEPARITTEASLDTLLGHVDYVAAIVDTATRATTVRILVTNRHAVLKRDMYVRVLIESSAPRKGLLVPVSAVLRDDQNLPFVFVAAPDGGFNRRSITLGSRVGDRFEVTGGLQSGERVVSEGALFLQFAQSQ
jgi:membrane fusion protein, heavy metal efflux system